MYRKIGYLAIFFPRTSLPSRDYTLRVSEEAPGGAAVPDFVLHRRHAFALKNSYVFRYRRVVSIARDNGELIARTHTHRPLGFFTSKKAAALMQRRFILGTEDKYLGSILHWERERDAISLYFVSFYFRFIRRMNESEARRY